MDNESIKERLDRYRQTLDELKRQRQPHESEWKDTSRFLLHANGLYDGEKPGEYVPRKSDSLDSRPTKYMKNFAAMMHAGLTSPARPWFMSATEDSDLMEDRGVKKWLSTLDKRYYQAYRKSNFYSSIHSGYLELIGFGIQACYMEESWSRYLSFTPQTIGTYWVAQNDHGFVDTLYRRFAMTARNMAVRFGKDKLSNVVKSALDRSAQSYFNVIHVVEPRKQFDPRRIDYSGMPFSSCYFEEGTADDILHEGGFHEFPYLTSRWETFGNNPYGGSPAADVMPDVKQLTAVIRTQTTAIHKELDPPMALGANSDRLNLLPGSQNKGFINPSGELLAKPLYEVRPNIQHGVALRDDIRDAIQSGFFNDLFLFMLQRKDITATEVAERHEEKLLMLGPAIERQQSELFNPLFDRTFSILMRNRHLPPPPRELEGKELRVEYISLLAQAQKIVGVSGIDSMVQFVGGLSAAWPDALDKLDVDEVIDIRADMVGVDRSIIVSDAEVAKKRDARAQAQQAAAMDQAMMNAAQTGKVMSETKVNPGERTAYTDAAESMGGGALQ